MNRKHYIAILLAVSFFGMAALTYWYFKPQKIPTGDLASSNSSPAAEPLITTSRPTLRTFERRVSWIGTVESRASVELRALVAGRIELIAAEDQRQLQKGQLVMRLGGSQVEAVRAKLTEEIESLRLQIELDRQTVERLQQSLEAHLATKDQVASAREAHARLEARLREDQLSLKRLEDQIFISAPMGGTFTNRQVSVGQDIIPGQVVGEIIDTGRLRIAASIFPPQGIALQDKEAAINLSEKQTLIGLVRRVLPQAASTGAVTVWIEGPQIDAELRPGQSVAGSMVVETRPDALAVPESAVVYDAREHPHLFVRKGSSYEPLAIRVGLVQDGWVEVLSGLERDQWVVTQGAYELFYRQFNQQFRVQD